MRRVDSTRTYVLTPFLLCVKRYARKRASMPGAAFHAVEDLGPTTATLLGADDTSSINVSGLRTQGMMAAPATTSLDRIRAEVQAMRQEAASQKAVKEKAARIGKVKAEELKNEAHKALGNGKMDDEIRNLLRRQQKPNDAYFKGKEAVDGAQSAARMSYQTLFNEVDEVLRCKNAKDTAKYMQIVFPEVVAEASGVDMLKLVKELRKAHAQERNVIVGRYGTFFTDEQVSEMAWMAVLEKQSDEQLNLLWKLGLVDTDVLETIAEGTSTLEKSQSSEKGNATLEEQHLSREGGSVAVEQKQGQQFLNEFLRHIEDEDGGSTAFPLEERLDKLEEVYYAQELIRSIRDTTLSGKPTIDLAPILQKVKQDRYEDITERELRLLEEYEEKVVPILLSTAAAAVPTKNASASAGKAATAAAPTVSVKVTEALLDRALVPSNHLLYAAAKYDDRLRRSLEGLERIKRESLLDPDFQDAVEVAHAIEEESVAPYVRGGNCSADLVQRGDADPEADSEGTRENQKQRHSRLERRISQRRGDRVGLRGPAARPQHAADVPYFYDSARNFVPTRGSFGLPAPSMTPEEKALLRGRRRRMRGKTRFS